MMTSGVPCLLPSVCLRLSLDYSWAHAKAKIDSKQFNKGKANRVKADKLKRFANALPIHIFQFVDYLFYYRYFLYSDPS